MPCGVLYVPVNLWYMQEWMAGDMILWWIDKFNERMSRKFD